MSNLWRKKVRITGLWNRNTLRLVRRLRNHKSCVKSRDLSRDLSQVKFATTLVNHE